MDTIARLRLLEDDRLANLLVNAERLEKEGTKSQRSEAAELLPELTDEIERRRQAANQRRRQKRASTPIEV